MTTLRLTRPLFLFSLALAVSFSQTGCTTSSSDGDSELSTELSSDSLDSSIDAPNADASSSVADASADLGAEASASGEPTSGDADLSLGEDSGTAGAQSTAAADAGGADSLEAPLVSDSDAKLTQQLASEDLSDTSGFDLDAQEKQPIAATPADPVVAAPSIDMSPVSEPQAATADASAPAADATQAAASAAPTGEPVTITNLKYVSGEGGGTVVIQTSAPATYQTREVPTQNQVVIEIENAKLPKALKRPFTTKDFNQPIASMNAYQEAGSTTARVVIQFRKPQQADVKQSGNTLTIASNGEGAGAAAGSQAQADLGAGDDMDVASNGKGDARILPSSATDPTGFDNTKFYGRPISIEVRDTAVRDVINLIAEQSGANIVLAGDVDGNISLKLRQVPWDEALLIVMKTRGLGYVRQGSILRVAPYDSLQKEVDAARKVADAQKAAEPLRVKVIPVGYAKVADLEKQISAFLTKERGKVVADSRTNSLIVTDTVEVLARVSNLVKAIDTPPLQVMIEGKVIEAREAFTRNLGINWGWDGQDVDVGGGRFLGQNLKINNGTNGAAGGLGGSSALSFGTLDVFGSLSASLRLYESEDIVHIISSPRVVVLNNEAANIVQGTNIPISTSTISGGTTTTTQSYIPIEMKLDVTPQVTSENDIILQIDIKREFVGNNSTPPDINKREAKTKVLVRNGSTAVVGGVYQSDTTDSEAGVPWLRRLPVVGWLFKQKTTNNTKSEMLVFLTPRILNAETAIQKENTL